MRSIRAAWLLIALCASAHASIAFVQSVDSGSNSCGTGGSTNTCSITLTGVGAGHTLLIFGTQFTTGVGISSLTDTNGSPSSLKTAQASGGAFGFMYYEKNTAAGTHTIQVNFTTSNWTDFTASEYSGADTTSPIDSGVNASCSAAGNTGSPACTIVTTGANEMAVGFLIESNITITVGSGWTSRNTVDHSQTQEQAAASAASYTNNTAATGSFVWNALGTALVPAAAAPIVSALPLLWAQIDTAAHPDNLFSNGFEAGTIAFDGWSANTGSPTYVTLPVFEGGFAQNFQNASLGGYTDLNANISSAIIRGQTLYGRLYFYLASNQTGASFWVLGTLDDTANTCEYFMLRTNGQMEMDVITPTTASVATTMASALTLQHWYRLEFKIPVMDTASQTVEMKIFDGTSSTPITGGDKTIANMNTLFSGGTKLTEIEVGINNVQAEPSTPPADVTVDNVAFGTIAWIGP